jgi:sulfite reductase (NADPH) flavoprotein alpha-component
VQHVLAARAEQLRLWVAQGAAIYVCGSLQGMAPAVHEALVAALGQAGVEQLDADGRYRRDVY